MALTADQQATLQLLLERGQSYSDLASLLGVDEAEVRSRARAALTELGGADPDRNVGLTDYLLGQADPIGRADVSRHLRDDAADHELANALAAQLRAMFPAAELPRLPGEPRRSRTRRRAKATGDAEAKRRSLPGSGLSQSQTRLIIGVGCGAVLLVAIVLGISGAFSGGSEASSQTSTTSTTSASDQPVQEVALKPTDGGNATGVATFGLATGDQPYVDVSIRGLDPAPQNKTYVVWLMLTDTQGYPLSPITVAQDGTFHDRYAIPAAVLPVVARVQFVDVSIAPVQAIRKLVRDAIKNTSLVIDEPGDTVLRGEIPKNSQQKGQ